jgi:predicted alpha/beta superfamily hydrolase
VSGLNAQNNIHFKIKSFPKYHAEGSSIYAAGTFNGWHPQEEAYKFKKNENGELILNLSLSPGIYEYKLTRGDWDKVECNVNGRSIENRILNVINDQTVDLTIEEWQDRFPGQPRENTISKNVHILDNAFVMPQLKRIRRIWIYLPEDYSKNTAERYPVIYMQDGQNVFNNATSYSGEWEVDEFLDSTSLNPCIVVAIDHAAKKRMNEYNPFDNKRFGAGQGNAYVNFIVNTLIPYVNGHYRTMGNKENTFIAGSSMGGLISLYAVLKYPAAFGGAGIFSPSLRIAGEKIYNAIKSMGNTVKSKIYFYCGGKENEWMVDDMQKAVKQLSAVSNSLIKTEINDNGQHNEQTWKKEFSKFYSWIMSDK